VRRRPSLRLAALVVVGLLGAALVGPNSADASGEPPAGYAAVVRGIAGRAGWIPMGQFEKRKTQVRAERRVAGGNDRSSVGEASLWQLLEEVEVEAEAFQIGIRVDSHRVARQFRRVKHRDFSSIGQFQAFLKRIHLTEDEARRRIKVQLLFSRIEDRVLAGVPPHRKSLPYSASATSTFGDGGPERPVARPSQPNGAQTVRHCRWELPVSLADQCPERCTSRRTTPVLHASYQSRPSRPGSGRMNNGRASECPSHLLLGGPSSRRMRQR
jgi:hypothetical protein